ncbi:Metallo-dependent phosphatase [Mycena venus]|uniref:Metallo-dependent phosphatase n=1 Tax=Mycena venus TaxID=2733690 RepID=A0A8H6YA85_9AGAR|nr:Metallo-dependent phosphatase [Mycena venus]
MSKPVAQNTDGIISGTTVLNIAHFNDVYQVSDQKIYPGGKEETINVTKFASSLFDITSNWKKREDGSKDGLTVFSGDGFSPSIESSVTRGRHMPPILNGLGVDIGVVGNHEFDFGFPQLKKLLTDTRFPWLLSNILDTNTGKVPEPLKDAHVIEKAGIRIGLIGLIEKDWIATITGWPENFEYQDMAKIGKELSVKLRDPAGEYKCDMIIALTHSRISNDIKLAKALFALSPTAQAKTNIGSEHGVDLILGGHDHVYWISKGVTEWDGYDLQTPHPDAKEDQGEVLVIKSGTDFQDISEVILTLKDAPDGSIRNKLIQEIKGKRHVTRGTTAVNEDIKAIFDHELKTFSDSMSKPICITDVLIDVQSKTVRLQESVIGNWVTDCLRHAYDEALAKLGYDKVDGVITGSGIFRGGHIYQPGFITLGDLSTILPYPDPTIVVEIDANTLWDTFESGLSHHPSQEGYVRYSAEVRYLLTASFKGVSRPSQAFVFLGTVGRRPATAFSEYGCLLNPTASLGQMESLSWLTREEVLRTSTRKYLIMTREYMWEGGDGYDALKGKKLIITSENGQTMSALIRKFLLGAQFLNQKIQQKPEDRGTGSSLPLKNLIGDVEGQLQKWQSLPHLPQIKGLPSLPTPSLPSLSSFSPHAISTPSFARPQIPKLGSSLSSLDAKLQNVRSNLPHLPNVSGSLSDVSDHAQKVLQGVVPAIRWLASRALLAAALLVADHEDMGSVDAYERQRARAEVQLMRADPNTVNNNLRLALPIFFAAQTQSRQDVSAKADEADTEIDAMEADAEKALPVIHPVVDGRFKDIALG